MIRPAGSGSVGSASFASVAPPTCLYRHGGFVSFAPLDRVSSPEPQERRTITTIVCDCRTRPLIVGGRQNSENLKQSESTGH